MYVFKNNGRLGNLALNKHISRVLVLFLLVISLSGIAHAEGWITVTNLNSTYTTNDLGGVEVGFEQYLQINGSGFTTYANKEILINVFAENASYRWDRTSLQWGFPVRAQVDADGNFSIKIYFPWAEEVVAGTTYIPSGQYFIPGKQRVAVSNGTLGDIRWVRRNTTVNASTLFVINASFSASPVLVGYANGIVQSINKTTDFTTTQPQYLADLYNGVLWTYNTTIIQIIDDIWADDGAVYSCGRTTTFGLNKINLTTGALLLRQNLSGACYGIWGDDKYVYVTSTSSYAPRVYNKTDLQLIYSNFTSYAQSAWDLWVGDRVYVGYADGMVYAYSLVGGVVWSAKNTSAQINGIYGDANYIYVATNSGGLMKYNKTDGYLEWNITDYSNYNFVSLYVNDKYVFVGANDGRLLYFNKTNGNGRMYPHYIYMLTATRTSAGVLQPLMDLHGGGNYIYSAYNGGWIIKEDENDDLMDWHPEADFWLRDAVDTWNFIWKPTKPVFSSHETASFEFLVFDNKTNPVNVLNSSLQGSYFQYRISRLYNQWETTAANLQLVDPRTSLGYVNAYGARPYFYNNLTVTACPALNYDNGTTGPPSFANRTGWYESAAWCLYQNASMREPIYSTMNATALPSNIKYLIRPKEMVNDSIDDMWYTILQGDTSDPFRNLTKHYGNDKWTWYATFGSNAGYTYPSRLDTGVLGMVMKDGDQYQYSWGNKWGQSHYWNIGYSGTTASTYMYSMWSLARNSSPYEMYWVFSDTTTAPFIASGIENSTIAIAYPLTVIYGEDEENLAGWTINGSVYKHRRNITYVEGGYVDRFDEPVRFSFDPYSNITADCRDVRILPGNGTDVVLTYQNETCSPNNITFWHFITVNKGDQASVYVYFNSSAPALNWAYNNTYIMYTGTCPSQLITIQFAPLAYISNYSLYYNWTAFGAESNEYIRFGNGNNASIWGTNPQNFKWGYNNGTVSVAAGTGGWTTRCLKETGPVYTKFQANMTGMPTTLRSISIYGTVTVFSKSGRLKIEMTPNTTLIDPVDNYPAYFRYGLDTIAPQGKTTTLMYNIWDDWAGRRELLDKTVFGEPMFNFTLDPKANTTANTDSYANKMTFKQFLPSEFSLNFNVTSPTCVSYQILPLSIYRSAVHPAGATLATIDGSATILYEFAVCHKSIYPSISAQPNGILINTPDLRLYGADYYKFVDPTLYAKFYIYPTTYSTFSREYRYIPFVSAKYMTTAKATLSVLDTCPDVEHGYNSYAEMFDNITETTLAYRVTNGNYSGCIANVLKLTDTNGADKLEFILSKNSSVYWGEVRRLDMPYPSRNASNLNYETTANKLAYIYGNWYATLTSNPYVINGYMTSGVPQFTDYDYYYYAPSEYFNKYVWDETYFTDKNNTQLLGGSGINIGAETQDPRGFLCNPVALSATVYESTTRKGWQHGGYVAAACPAYSESMKHYAYHIMGYTSYTAYNAGGSASGAYDIYLCGKNNQTGDGTVTRTWNQSGTHNPLFDYKHFADGTNTEIQSSSDLDENERHMNKQPWVCMESSRVNRSFCLAYSSNSKFVYSASVGTANEQALWGQDYSTGAELNRFIFYTRTRYGTSTAYSYDHRLYQYIYPFTSAGEYSTNLYYFGEEPSETAISFIYPDAWKPMMQGYLFGFDPGDSFWITFDQDSRQYSPTQSVTINGTLYKNKQRMDNKNVLITVLKADGTFVNNSIATTDTMGRFNWTFAIPFTASPGLYYVQADYNSGEILTKAGFKVTSNSVTLSTDKVAYGALETVTSSVVVTNYLTGSLKDPDGLVLRYYSPDGSQIRCAKYPSTLSVSGCDYDLTKTSTGGYSDSFSLSSSPLEGTYVLRLTTIDSGIEAYFYGSFAVAQFTGWIDVSPNNQVSGTSFVSNITASNTGTTTVTKVIELTVPTSCGYISMVTNNTGSLVNYNIIDLDNACKVYWNVTLGGLGSTWFKLNATIPASAATPADIWAYANRTLTDYNQTQMWTLLDQLINNQSVIAGLIKGISSISAEDVWSYTSRNLTYIDWGSGAQFVWNASNRNLTWFPVSSGLTAQQVWEYADRNLTYGDWVRYNNISNLYANHTKTQSLINGLANISAEDVWVYSSRILTDYNQTTLWVYLNNINSSQISAGDVWSAAGRTLDDYSGVWSYATRTLTDYNQTDMLIYIEGINASINKLNLTIVAINETTTETKNTLEKVNATVSAINSTLTAMNITITYLNDTMDSRIWAFESRNLSNGWSAYITDFGEVLATKNYHVSVQVTDINGYDRNCTNGPWVTLIDPNLNVIVEDVGMTYVSEGLYTYNYTTSSGQTAGVWQTKVKVNLGGKNHTLLDYWELETNPAQVLVDVIDVVGPSITCQISIENEGSSNQEYQYRWWITNVISGQWGEASMVDGGSAAKLLTPGENWTTTKAMIPGAFGTYWCKAIVFYGTEQSGASDMFVYDHDEGGGAPSAPGGGVSYPKGIFPPMTGIFNMSLDVINERYGMGETVGAYIGIVTSLGNVTDGVLTIYLKDMNDNTHSAKEIEYNPVPGYIVEKLDLPDNALPGRWEFVAKFVSKNKGVEVEASDTFYVDKDRILNKVTYALIGAVILIALLLITVFFLLRAKSRVNNNNL